MLDKDISNILVDSERLQTIVKELAEKINRDYEGKEILFVIILKGSIPFAADLMKHINTHLLVDCMQASSYGNSTISSGNINITKDLSIDCAGKDVLLIEDIIDSGNTLSCLKKLMTDRGCASVKICTLLSKPSRRTVDIEGDYVGTEIPDEFVVGYGLDYAEKYRNLPYVGILKPEVYNH